MPNIKSAEKRVKINAKKSARNRIVKTQVKHAVKKVRLAPAGQADQTLSAAYSSLDRAVSKGVVHKNTANRKKARLARAVQKAQ